MLPAKIIANWCITTAKWEDLSDVLRDYVPNETHQFRETFAASWTERTLMTFGFGDANWAKTDDSIIVENQRAILWKEDSRGSDRTHLIFVGLLQSSLLHLKNDITTRVYEKLGKEVRSVEFALGRGVEKLLSSDFSSALVGGEWLSRIGHDRLIYWGKGPKRLPFGWPDWPYFSLQDDFEIGEAGPYTFVADVLYLRLGQSKTDLTVSRDGTLTFSDTELTLAEIADVVSDVAELIPIKVTDSEQVNETNERDDNLEV